MIPYFHLISMVNVYLSGKGSERNTWRGGGGVETNTLFKSWSLFIE